MDLVKNSIEMRGVIDKFKILTESYVFPSHNQRGIGELPEEKIEPELDDIGFDETLPDTSSDDNYKEKISEIRKLALGVMQDLDPGVDMEKYKTVKTILDSCDKIITNKNVETNKITEK